jgi:ribokinase
MGALGKVCVVGSINLDLMVQVDHTPAPGETIMGQMLGKMPGGKGFNQAVAAHRCGASTQFVGQVGADSEAQHLRKVCAQIGLSDRYLLTNPQAPTGSAYIYCQSGGENSIIVVPGANEQLDLTHLPHALVGADLMMVQMEIGAQAAKTAMAISQHLGVLTLLNAAPSRDVGPEHLALADILVVNETEAEDLGGFDALRQAGPSLIVMTLGANGVMWAEQDAPAQTASAFPVNVVDTTGSGDAFCGAFTAALAFGHSIEDAISHASAAGALTATAMGAQSINLSSENIQAMISNSPQIKQVVL